MYWISSHHRVPATGYILHGSRPIKFFLPTVSGGSPCVMCAPGAGRVERCTPSPLPFHDTGLLLRDPVLLRQCHTSYTRTHPWHHLSTQLPTVQIKFDHSFVPSSLLVERNSLKKSSLVFLEVVGYKQINGNFSMSAPTSPGVLDPCHANNAFDILLHSPRALPITLSCWC